MRPSVPRIAALSRIARWAGASWSSRAAIRARSVPGSATSTSSSPTRGGELGELGEEQRVAAAAVVEPIDAGRCSDAAPATASTSAAVSHSSSGPIGSLSVSARSTGGGQSSSSPGRYAVTISSGLSARLRADQLEQFAQQRVRPLEIVDPDDDRAAHRAQADRRDQRVVQRIAGAGGVERVELRRVPEQMEQRLDLVAAPACASGGRSYIGGRSPRPRSRAPRPPVDRAAEPMPAANP